MGAVSLPIFISSRHQTRLQAIGPADSDRLLRGGARAAGGAAGAPPSFWAVASQIWRQEGAAGFAAGLRPRVMALAPGR